MSRSLSVVLCLSLAVCLFSSCGKSPDTARVTDAQPPADAASSQILDISDCKWNLTGIPRVSPASAQDCVEWWYSGIDVLHLRHVNAAFNCCPVVDADIRIDGNTITVEEIELQGNCMCLCLYDVDYEIVGISPGIYTVTFIEPYLPLGDPVLTCPLDLVESPMGGFCVDRTGYPWDIVGPD